MSNIEENKKEGVKAGESDRRSSLLSIILFPLLIVIVISVVLGSVLFSSLIVREAEKKDHQRIESLEELVFEFIKDKEEQIYDLPYLLSLKKKTGFDISFYGKEGIISTSLWDPSDPLRNSVPFNQEYISSLLFIKDEKAAHIHEHFTLENNVYMVSYYLFSEKNFESPVIIGLISSAASFYKLRNDISLIIILAIILILGSLFLFLLFIIRKYVSRPAKDLIKTVREVAGGNLKIAAPQTPYGEIGDLGEHISIMINKLREAREREEEVNKMKTEILSIASHHLRTPLSALKWSLRIILDEEVGKINSLEQKDMLEKAYDSNERMIELVNDLLDVTRIEEGRFGYSWSYGQIEDIIQEVVDESGPRVKKAGLEIFYSNPFKALPKIKMDPSKIRLVLSNLLDNAIKYTLKGEIGISVGYKNLEITINIKDTGIGIPAIEKPKVFTKFFRASNAAVFQSHGTGLGLFIVKSIVEKHGGKIWFESEENQGSKFSFSLPVEKRFAPREKYLEFLENI